MVAISTTEWIVGSLMVALALISMMGSFTVLWIVRALKLWNGYIMLVVSLTICQIIYDLNFFLLTCYFVPTCEKLTIIMSTFGGLATSFWTNVISVIVTGIVINLRSFNIRAYYYWFFGIVMVPAILIAILEEVYSFGQGNIGNENIVSYIYYALRLASILFNIITYFICSCKLRRMGYKMGSSIHDDPVHALVSRFKYYPLWQIFSRSGAIWYELAYGFGSEGYYSQSSPTETAALYLFAIANSACGLGYFLIFLAMQPSAYAYLKGVVLGTNNTINSSDNSANSGRIDLTNNNNYNNTGAGDQHHSNRNMTTCFADDNSVHPEHGGGAMFDDEFSEVRHTDDTPESGTGSDKLQLKSSLLEGHTAPSTGRLWSTDMVSSTRKLWQGTGTGTGRHGHGHIGANSVDSASSSSLSMSVRRLDEEELSKLIAAKYHTNDDSNLI